MSRPPARTSRTARKKARAFAELVRQMEELPTMSAEDELSSWDVCSALERDLGYSEQELDRLFKDVVEDEPLTAGPRNAGDKG